jgi:hypothetical protein
MERSAGRLKQSWLEMPIWLSQALDVIEDYRRGLADAERSEPSLYERINSGEI